MMFRPLKKRIKNWLIYATVRLLVSHFRSTNRFAAIKQMRFFATIAFRLAKKEREKTIKHLKWAFAKEKSEQEIQQLAKRVFLHFATVAADAIRLPQMVKEGINHFFVVKDARFLDSSRDKGRGAIVLAGHFGNWEVLGAWLAQNGYPLKVVGRTAYDSRLDRMIVETRNSSGYGNIPRGKGTREIIRALRQGQFLGLLVDQDTKVDGIFVDFFSRPAHTATGPVLLAQKFNVPILPVFNPLDENFRYHLVSEPPIELVSTGDAEHDLRENTQRCSNAYERMIRQYPWQWVWMHERWKKQPAEMTP